MRCELDHDRPARYADPADDLADIDARPDLVVLAYPVISFVGGLKDFRLTSWPEAVIAVTNRGQLILRTISTR